MNMQDEQEKALNLHIRKVKRTHVLHYHKLEQDLLREVGFEFEFEFEKLFLFYIFEIELKIL